MASTDDHVEAGDKPEAPTTIKSAEVVDKYQSAADICNKALKKVLDAVQVGAKVLDLCELGDKTITEGASSVYKSSKIAKGIAFPTCVSTNNIVCHFNPLRSDPQAETLLVDGDVVKVELGAHIDGFIAQVAHTVVVGATKENPIKGRKADAIQAAYLASEAALRLLRPGKKNSEVTEVVGKVADAFKVKPVEDMLSHQLEKNVIDGTKSIILNPSENNKKEHKETTFEEFEVYTLDIIVSTGEGKAKPADIRTTVFKKTNSTYMLKMKASRTVLNEVNQKFGSMCFSLRSMEDEKKARMGIVECSNHGIVKPYDVYAEKEGEIVAQFAFTVLLLSGGPLKITQFPYDASLVQSENSIVDEDLKKLLASAVRTKKKAANKKKKAAGKEGEAAGNEEADAE